MLICDFSCWFRPAAAIAALSLLVACTEIKTPGSVTDTQVIPPEVETQTKIGLDLSDLPPPKRKIDIAVYAYADKTGQQKPADNISRFSKAVTQGADAILVDVLKDAGEGHWFNVVERSGLNNLLNERNIIDRSNQSYRGATRSSLPPLRFAGIILEGGIINYDSNVITSGAGARYLAIGPSVRYRRDVLTVALRTVSVSTGEVLNSVTTTKTIYSTLLQGSVFRFVAIDELLEIDAGFSRNEPVGLAVRQAIELAVYSLILDGAKKGLWSFRNRGVERELLDHYEGRVPSRVASYVPEVKPKSRPASPKRVDETAPLTTTGPVSDTKSTANEVSESTAITTARPVFRASRVSSSEKAADTTSAVVVETSTKPVFRPTTLSSSEEKEISSSELTADNQTASVSNDGSKKTVVAAVARWRTKQRGARADVQ